MYGREHSAMSVEGTKRKLEALLRPAPAGSPMLHRLVINADDFGLAKEVNEAVESAHRMGALTAASLMVSGAAAIDAIARARRLPELNIGLHLTLLEGHAVLGQDHIPDLLAANGRLRTDQVRLAVELVRSQDTRRQLRAEIEAQFESFVRTGLKLDHVNVHKHFHLHPVVLSDLLAIARQFGAPAVRIPVEPRKPIWEIDRTAPGLSGLALQAHATFLRRIARRAGFLVPDAVFGLAWSGAFTRSRLSALLGRLPAGLVEIYLHPASANTFAGCAMGYRYCDEFAALTSADVVTRVGGFGTKVGGYADVGHSASAIVPPVIACANAR
ncbi:Hopanoid biosynthesis associated protein HpnK [Bradyrhizobium sp. ORS 375]|nr:Hopanoid biosynthesis associated protein HpnK [Bradyrhizobium sp. ORS 375]